MSFQQCLKILHCNCQRLRVFMDVFLGTYKDGTNNSRDLRYFAGVFFVLRLLYISLVSYLNVHFAVTLNAVILSIFLFLLAVFRPPKSSSHFITDYTFILLMLFVAIVVLANDNPNGNNPLQSLSQLVSCAALAPHLIYFAGLVAFWLFVKKNLAQRVFRGIQKCCHALVHNEERNLLDM